MCVTVSVLRSANIHSVSEQRAALRFGMTCFICSAIVERTGVCVREVVPVQAASGSEPVLEVDSQSEGSVFDRDHEVLH